MSEPLHLGSGLSVSSRSSEILLAVIARCLTLPLTLTLTITITLVLLAVIARCASSTRPSPSRRPRVTPTLTLTLTLTLTQVRALDEAVAEPPPEEEAPSTQLMDVTVPAGHMPGQPLLVTAPDGNDYEVTLTLT